MALEDRLMKRAVVSLEAGLEARDVGAITGAINALLAALPHSDQEDASAAVPRLTELLPHIPPWLEGMLAVIIGACVELGAEPVVCAPAVLDSARGGLRRTADFPARWAAAGGGVPPIPESAIQIPEWAVEQLGGADASEADILSLMAWWQVEQWELATVAMLTHRPIRDGLAERAQFRSEAERVALLGRGDLLSMRHIVRMLDDEPLLVLHRPTRTAYRMRMSGLGDLWQLQTLLGDVLIGGGHVAGAAPDPVAVGLARDMPFGPGVPAPAAMASAPFTLADADGREVPADGCPDDIPPVDGVRVLVLYSARRPGTWPAGRLFPNVPGSLVLDEALSEPEAAAWFAKLAR
ncbi:hypothetical protein GCM10023205_27410 [Yinghuangia aomiensis]|uniref:Uncharacterized protein n=1 Tax=Yinghuangia aomiensis TaxID=676205 RepID=A0ABP9H4G1_9ACTN